MRVMRGMRLWHGTRRLRGWVGWQMQWLRDHLRTRRVLSKAGRVRMWTLHRVHRGRIYSPVWARECW